MVKQSGLEMSRRNALGAFGLGASSILAASGAAAATAAADKVTIHHVEGRRSQRIIWFCEEAGIPYDVVYKRGDVLGSLNALKLVNPDMPVAPTVVFRGEMLVESGGIMEYLMTQFGSAALLAPVPSSPDFAQYKMWMHFAEGSAMPHLSTDLGKLAKTGGMLQPKILGPVKLVGSLDVIQFMEKFISAHPYFGGKNFSAADIMYDIVMIIIDNLQVDKASYPNLLQWHERMKARPAYARAMKAGNPDNVVLKVNIPSAAPTTAAAPAAASGQYSTATTTIGVLLADPAARGLIDNLFPEFTKSSSVASGVVNSMTLKALQQFKPDMFTNEALATLDAAFGKLPVK